MRTASPSALKKQYYEDEFDALHIGMQRYVQARNIPVVPRPPEPEPESELVSDDDEVPGTMKPDEVSALLDEPIGPHEVVDVSDEGDDFESGD